VKCEIFHWKVKKGSGKMSMRVKAVAVLMAVIFVFTSASFLLSLSFSQKSLAETLEKDLTLALDIADRLVSTQIELLKSDAFTVVERLLKSGSEEETELIMAAQIEEYPNFLSLTILDAEGIVANYGLPTCAEASYESSNYMQWAFSGKDNISTTHYDTENGNFIMHVFVPMGEDRVLSATISGMTFSDLVSGFKLWESGNIFMFDGEGAIIADRQSELVTSRFNVITDGGDNNDSANLNEFFAGALSGDQPGSGTYTFMGQKRFCVYKKVAGAAADWRIAVAAPLNESPGANVLTALAISAVIFLAAGFVFAILISGVVIKPFKKIEAQALQIKDEKKRAKLLLDSTPLACHLFDKNARFFECNEENLRLYKIDAKQEFFDNFYAFFPERQPDGRLSSEFAAEMQKKAFEDGRCVFECMQQASDGTPIPAEITLVRVKYEGEDVIAGYARDLSEQKEMSKEIEEAHQQTRLLLDAMPLACRLWNKDFEIFDCNEKNLELFQMDDKQKFMEQFFKLSPERQPDGELSREKTIAILEKVFREGKYVFEWTHLLPDGTLLPCEITLVRVKYDDDYVVAGYTRDLREHKKMMDEINEKTQSVIEANEAKSDFLANMSHEMRTPLNAVIGLSELALENKDLPEEAQASFEKIYRAGDTLLCLVNDILDISKVESGKFELLAGEYDTPSLINDTITNNILRLEEKPVEFILNIGADFPAQLYGDELRLKQILSNLLSNAFKYTQEGTVEMSIDHVRDGETVWVTAKIKDSGAGIKPENIGNLFSNYIQVDAKANRKIEGTGLGLPIAKKMAELMNGDISVESEYGKGSTFTLKVKQKYVSDSTIGAEVVENLKSFRYSDHKRRKNSKLVRVKLPYAKVLVVDDSLTNLDVAKGLMKPYEMQIDCVTSGQQAIDAISNEKVKYNAVFMDHMMPGMDGIEAAEKIRALGTEYAKNIPIIALTANAIVGNEQIFLSKGFQAFLTKPIDLLRLDAAICKWVRNKSMENEKIPADDPRQEAVAANAANAAKRNLLDRKISGIDIKAALAHFNDDADMLLYILRSFAVNTKPLLEKAASVSIETLAEYAVTVHGIKGSSRNICADAIGKQAEALEWAAKAGDYDFVEKNNPALIEAAAKLVSGLDEMLAGLDGNAEKGKKYKPDAGLLKRLSAACNCYDMNTVDEVMAELESYEYENGDDFIKWLKENIGQLNLSDVVERISDITGQESS